MIADRFEPDLPPPDPALRACVIIPARDEAAEIPLTLAALAEQRDIRGGRLDPRLVEVIVLANNCSDDTAEVARRSARGSDSRIVLHVVERAFPATQAHVGTARRWVMDLACDRLEAIGQPRGLIASTDADTRVAPRWIAASLAAVDSGAEAVAGVIQTDPAELRRLGPAVRRASWQDRVYRRLKLELEALIDPNPLDPFPRHDFHGGASLAITAATYRRVGGLPPLPCLEDVALAEALWRIDARFVHSPRVRVRTSARSMGRTAGGHSQAITRWLAGQSDQVVASAGVEAELRARSQLRRFFTASKHSRFSRWSSAGLDRDGLAQLLRVDSAALGAIMAETEFFGQWLEEVAQLQRSTGSNLVAIESAIAGLRSRVREIRRAGRV